MKYLGIFFVVLMFFVGNISFVKAEESEVSESTSFERPKSIRARLQQQQAQYKQSLDRVHNIRTELNNAKNPEERFEIQKMARHGFIQRIEMAIDRLEVMYDRIDNRIIQVEEMGYETSDAKKYLREAKENIDDVREGLTEMKDIIDDFDRQSNEPNIVNLKIEVRELFPKIKEDIKNAHMNLVSALHSLREIIQQIQQVENVEIQGTTEVEDDGNRDTEEQDHNETEY